MERRGRTAERAIAASIGAAPAQHTSTGILLRSNMLEVRGQDNLGIFLKGFQTWTGSNRFDTVLPWILKQQCARQMVLHVPWITSTSIDVT